MANQTASNREAVEETALAISFSKEKSLPLIPAAYAGKSGAVTYSSIRSALKKSNPELSGDALTARVNQEMNAINGTTLAGVLQLHREGFNFTKFNGRELKNGTRNVSIAMSNRGDVKAPKAKKIDEYSVEELQALIALKTKVDQAETVIDVAAEVSAE